MFKSVLVANRGEIAVRICKTLRKMGIRSVVVASIPDRRSMAVRSADAWVLLEGYSAAESYLDIDAIIAAAKAEGCDAIHPGYGFLSERADFAERCASEGITFIGPPPGVLRSLGDKSSARRMAVAAGVPVVPGWDGADDDETLLREAEAIGFPLMVKARGGGGGRGMREVHASSELPEAITSARREAQSAFGDPGLLLERLVKEAHHVEVQVFGDTQGNLIHLGERDCSVQRRRQKLIEESPSPVVDDELRGRLTTAALTLARSAGYVNAGTVEFLVGPPGSEGRRPFYFLEVNPRLQVEHPVTEMVTGLDLVELQLRVAAGEPLPLTQEHVVFTGHAIEFRINAEDPWDNFKPSVGRVGAVSGTIEPRMDAGFDEGDTVASQYDSLLAKVVLHGADREAVLRGIEEDGIATFTLEWPARTNASLLDAIAGDGDFRSGAATIDWLEGRLARLLERSALPASAFGAVAVRARRERSQTDQNVRMYGRLSPFDQSPWIGAAEPFLFLDDGRRTAAVSVTFSGPTSGTATVDDVALPFTVSGTLVRVGEPPRTWDVHWFFASSVASVAEPTERGFAAQVRSVPPPPLPRRAQTASAGATAITAPLPGTIVDIRVSEGDVVEVGQLLALLEAMKMEHRITATSAGTVKRIAVKARDTVRDGDLLIEIG